MNYRKQQISVHVMGIKASNICLIYDLCNANICMYVQTYGIGLFDETLWSKKWHMQLLFYDKAWTTLARNKIRKGQ